MGGEWKRVARKQSPGETRTRGPEETGSPTRGERGSPESDPVGECGSGLRWIEGRSSSRAARGGRERALAVEHERDRVQDRGDAQGVLDLQGRGPALPELLLVRIEARAAAVDRGNGQALELEVAA